MAKSDKKAMELIQEVRKQRAEITLVERSNWKTNCAFTYREGSSDIQNLQVVSAIKDLIAMAAFLMEKGRSYREAATHIGAESAPPFTWCGFTLEEWLEDLKTRVSKVQLTAKRKKLESLESRLNALVSPELRAELELQAIAADLESS